MAELQDAKRATARGYTPLSGKIALEEAFTLPDMEQLSSVHPWQKTERYKPIIKGLRDIYGRIDKMDRYGVELEVLSLNSPGLQGIPDASVAESCMQRANDELADIVGRRPDRFAGFAALAMHRPDVAARELERCGSELGFKGALINGFQNVGDSATAAYLDEIQYLPFWQQAEALGVPIYIHPRDFLESQQRIIEGRPEMHASVWAYTPETAGHAMRLILSGLFDICPRLQIVLGHLGEALSFLIDRIDRRLEYVEESMETRLKHPPSYYLRNNFHFTTAGAFDTLALQNAIGVMGVDRILFSIDDPFETIEDAVDWFETTPLAPEARRRIGIDNAKRLLRLEGKAPPHRAAAPPCDRPSL